MAKGRKKRQVEKRNQEDARKIVIWTVVITVVLLILAYWAFKRSF